MKTTPQTPALAGMTPLGIKPNTPPPARAVLVNNEWHVIDQSGLTIATCADRGLDARLLADAVNTYDLMLAALRDIETWCANAEKSVGIEPYGLSVARAAIAKAEGRS